MYNYYQLGEIEMFGQTEEGTMINHILVPLDGATLAECVLPHVSAIANAFIARINYCSMLLQMTDFKLPEIGEVGFCFTAFRLNPPLVVCDRILCMFLRLVRAAKEVQT